MLISSANFTLESMSGAAVMGVQCEQEGAEHTSLWETGTWKSLPNLLLDLCHSKSSSPAKELGLQVSHRVL